MKKLIALLLSAALLILAVPAMADEEKVVNIFTWADYIDADTLNGFEQETGIKVNFYNFEDNETMLMKLQNSKGEYDLILTSDYTLSAAKKLGLLLPLDREKLTNFGNINEKYLNQFFDPENVYSIPYAVGVPTIVYDPERVEGEITSLNDLWDEQFLDGVCIINDARVMIGAVLKTLGYSYNTTDDAELQEAKEKLMSLSKNIRIMDYNNQQFYLLSGEVKAAYMFTPFAVLAQMENPNLKVVFVSEGIGYGIDSLCIPANAQHPDSAMELINYIMRPEVAAHIAEYQCYVNPNKAADALISPDYAAYTALNLPEELLPTSEFIQDLGDYEAVYQQIWEEFMLKRN